jgi:FMN phosphatase YigB (HAD superfamily)
MQMAIGFDFDHTLGIDQKLERTVGLEIVETLSGARGVPFDRAAATVVFDAALASARNGGVPIETAFEGALLELAGPGLENTQAVGHFRDEVIARAPQFVKGLPGVTEMLAALDGLDVRYAVLTNGWSPLQEEKARLIGFHGPVLVSERIGARKPAAAAFAFLVRQLERTPQEVWYVGDDPAIDCEGARAAGLVPVWFDWEGLAYPERLAAPDFVIHALAELPPLVQGHLAGLAKANE